MLRYCPPDELENGMEAAQQLENARQLLKLGKMAESLAAFQNVAGNALLSAEGHYGIGYIKLKEGDLSGAAAAFRESLKADPNHANSAFQLGVIAQDQAQIYFQRALRANPNLAPAIQKRQNQFAMSVEALPPPPPLPPVPPLPPPPPQPPSRSPSIASSGFYAILRADPTPIAREAVDLIESLNMSVRPRLSAYLARFLAFLILPFLVILILKIATANERNTGGLLATVFMICLSFSALAIFLLILKVKSRRFTFEQGRILIASGIIMKKKTNIELYRVSDIETHQTFWNRITGDGVLILSVEHGGRDAKKVALRGLEKNNRLDTTASKLRNLVLLLRSGNWGKGIIY
jgi:tetratricopeptide (TPR) repeat protein